MSDERSFLETWSDVIKKTGQTHTFGQPSELERQLAQAQADLAAHKAALADVVESGKVILAAFDAPLSVMGGVTVHFDSGDIARFRKAINSTPPDAAPYAKVLEAARRYDEARIARPLLYAKKRAEYRLLDNLTVTYLREADEPLAQAQADLHEALAAIEEPRR